ncbi:ABC transporter ATP-binding protein [Mogibacterium pumilum]|uniref:ABC transporter ATP-binding protein n=1 Tax=Mogibacterium pumilum TaxID=86332 RepID=A0A223ATW9_9FIRM|nr:ABC transporter ATP-binding protein [Mogibacterium pumilum]ASS38423.1 ABC transporter ATP-binding protein [Mogibacterium pumilum]
MKHKLQRYFSLTDKGIDNMMRAARSSFFKYVSFILPPGVVFMFLNDLISGRLKSLYFYMGILTAVAIVMYLLTAREYKLTYDVTYEESVNLRIELAKKIKELPLSYFSTHNLSDLSQTIMMDVNNIEMAISHAVPESIGFAVFFVIITVMMCIGNLILGLAVVMPIWLGFAFLFITKNLQTKKIKVYYKSLLENSNAFQNAFEMQQEIKSYSLQDEVRADIASKLESSEKIHISAEFTMAINNAIIRVVPLLGPVLVAVIGASLYAKGSISLLYYVGYLMAVTTISHQYAALSEFIMTMFFFEDSFGRIRDLMDEKTQAGEDKEIRNYDICFKNVEFQYGDNKVINGTSFIAEQDAVTAIVGPSGCGKTTVLRLLSRLYDYDKGEITVGGEDIKSISTASLFSKISIVFQNVELFNTSVMENIRLGRKDATDEEVLAAAKLANVDEIAAKLPDGYATIIGENGSKLSGGERQRISIARAFLKDAPIILLDEISASLDVDNEMEIQSSINKLIKSKTVIIVSHRMKSIEKADKIIVMDDGKIVDSGNHDTLLKNSKLYGEMVRKSHLTEDYLY